MEAHLGGDAELRRVHDVAETFGQLVRDHQRHGLDRWLADADGSGVPEFREFARVLRRNHAAVAADVSSDWSNGQVECNVMRSESVRSHMYC